MNKFKKNKGITLVALIITIILLLILAVVSISAVAGDGIIDKAKEAREEYGKAQTNEKNALDEYLLYLDSNSGTFASLTVANYGDSVIYNKDLNEDGNMGNDWKVFYKDSTHLYIIASDYLDLDKNELPTGLGLSKGSTYIVSIGTLNNTGSENISDAVANKWKLSWLGKNVGTDGVTRVNNSNNNAKLTAALLNVNAWTAKFGDSTKGIEAIGTPTLEMWVASWNEKIADSKIYTKVSASGYSVRRFK